MSLTMSRPSFLSLTHRFCQRAFSSRSPGGYMLTGRQAKPKPTILMTGAVGQVGQESVTYLRQKYGPDCVVASDVRSPPRELLDSGTFLYLDVTDFTQVARVVLEQGITTIVHLAALLSATGESNPQLALRVNVAGVSNVLEVARLHNLRVFIPSTIAVFGPSTPTEAPDMCPMRPTTMYGVTKVHMELLGEYYHQKYAVDFRSGVRCDANDVGSCERSI
eukprot:1269454-Pleurochrysis_carterae.AAC.4